MRVGKDAQAAEATEALLSRGAQVDAEARGGGEGKGLTALVEAARLGMVDAMQRLVAAAPRLTTRRRKG